MRIGLLICLLLNFHALFGVQTYEGFRRYIGNYTVEARLDIIDKFLPENPTVFEVGAMNGDDSVKLAKKWPTGKIISFEANPNQFEKYREKAMLHSNMYGYNLAVNTFNGVTPFYICWGSSGDNPVFEGASSLLPPSESMKIHYQGPIINIPCVIFDDWCDDNGVTQIDFVWLDLEGFELQLFKSSPKIFDTVSVIYTETNLYEFRQGTTQFKELKNYLESIGFRLLAHWYNPGLQGDAIFVRRELL